MNSKPIACVMSLSLLAFACAAAEAPMDYGLGSYASAQAWQAGAAPVPMDYGLGAYASLEAWRDAGAAQTQLAQR